jgi:hypothetical protein
MAQATQDNAVQRGQKTQQARVHSHVPNQRRGVDVHGAFSCDWWAIIRNGTVRCDAIFKVDTMYIMLNNKHSIHGLLAGFPVLQSSVLAPRRCPAQ